MLYVGNVPQPAKEESALASILARLMVEREVKEALR